MTVYAKRQAGNAFAAITIVLFIAGVMFFGAGNFHLPILLLDIAAGVIMVAGIVTTVLIFSSKGEATIVAAVWFVMLLTFFYILERLLG